MVILGKCMGYIYIYTYIYIYNMYTLTFHTLQKCRVGHYIYNYIYICIIVDVCIHVYIFMTQKSDHSYLRHCALKSLTTPGIHPW